MKRGNQVEDRLSKPERDRYFSFGRLMRLLASRDQLASTISAIALGTPHRNILWKACCSALLGSGSVLSRSEILRLAFTFK